MSRIEIDPYYEEYLERKAQIVRHARNELANAWTTNEPGRPSPTPVYRRPYAPDALTGEERAAKTFLGVEASVRRATRTVAAHLDLEPKTRRYLVDAVERAIGEAAGAIATDEGERPLRAPREKRLERWHARSRTRADVVVLLDRTADVLRKQARTHARWHDAEATRTDV